MYICTMSNKMRDLACYITVCWSFKRFLHPSWFEWTTCKRDWVLFRLLIKVILECLQPIVKDHLRWVDLFSHHHIVNAKPILVTRIVSGTSFRHHNFKDDVVNQSAHIYIMFADLKNLFTTYFSDEIGLKPW